MLKTLDSEFLAKIEGLHLWPRFAQRSSQWGRRSASAFKGTSHEFVDYRPYTKGDEIKRIDWKVYARRERFFLRSYEGETNCTLCLVLDSSRSMDFQSPSAQISKWNFACQLVLGLTYVALKSRDASSLVLFGDQVLEWRMPKMSWDFFSEVDQLLHNFSRFSEKTDYPSSLKSLVEQIPKRSLVVVLSDFLGADIETIASSLEALASQRHEVVVLRILDPFELDLHSGKLGGDFLRFRALEREKPSDITVSLSEVEAEYSELMAHEEEVLRSRMLRRGIDFLRLVTNQDAASDLAKILRRREQFV